MTKKRINYRDKYKKYYGIEFSDEYDIHHIDFDRTNNEIDNLLLLPKRLHAKYHMALNALGAVNGVLEIDFKINTFAVTHNAKMLENLAVALAEINQWLIYKQQLEIQRHMERE